MSNIDKQALREAAEKATESDWIVDAHEGWHAVIPVADTVNGNYIIAEFQGPESKRNRDFVAAANPVTVLALLDELETKEEQRANWFQMAEKLGADLDIAEKRIAELPGQKRLIGWRMADYTDETADSALAKNWAAAVGVLPIFEGDVNTKLSAAMLQGADGNSLVIPDGYCIMPLKLTAANGAKGALSGEFHVIHRVVCQSCGGEGCEDCNEDGGWDAEIPVSWETIKRIHESAVEACALPAAPQQEVT